MALATRSRVHQLVVSNLLLVSFRHMPAENRASQNLRSNDFGSGTLRDAAVVMFAFSRQSQGIVPDSGCFVFAVVKSNVRHNA